MSAATVAPGQPGPRLNAAFYADSVAAPSVAVRPGEDCLFWVRMIHE